MKALQDVKLEWPCLEPQRRNSGSYFFTELTKEGEESAAASKIKEAHESKATFAISPLFLVFEAAGVP